MEGAQSVSGSRDQTLQLPPCSSTSAPNPASYGLNPSGERCSFLLSIEHILDSSVEVEGVGSAAVSLLVMGKICAPG